MRKVTFTAPNNEPNKFGVFHGFGKDFQEFDSGESGGCEFSTAIIETEDGQLHNIYVERVRFIDDENSESYANDSLIAAAPLLLEALQKQKQWLSKLQDWPGATAPDIDGINVAIASALGGQ